MFDSTLENRTLRISFAGTIGDEDWGLLYGEDFLSFERLRNVIEPVRNQCDSITLEICSGGGSLLDSIGIYNYLLSLDQYITAEVTGWAASAASHLIMAADEIHIHANSFLMIHEPANCSDGDRHQHRKAANLLDAFYRGLVDAYMTHATVERSQIESLVTSETWLDAESAIALGLADKVLDQIPIAAHASINSDFFSNIPKQLKGYAKMPRKNAKQKPAASIDAKTKNNDESSSESCADSTSESVENQASESAENNAESSSSAVDDSTSESVENNALALIEAKVIELEEENASLRTQLDAVNKQLGSVNARITRMSAGIRKAPAEQTDKQKTHSSITWEEIAKDVTTQDAYVKARKEHPEAFADYIKRMSDK